MTTTDFDVFGLGTVVIDHQMIIPGYPARNSKVEAHNQHIQVGGPVPTALVQLTRWGQRCAFAGSWADDPHGQMISEDLTVEGVDTSISTIHEGGRSGVAQVWIEKEVGSRTIACHRGSHTLEPFSLPQTRLLHLDGWSHTASIHAAEQVREQGGTVVLDTGSPKPGLSELLPLVHVLICPSHFMEKYFQDDDALAGARTLLEIGPRLVIHTRGENGATAYFADRQFHQPAHAVEAVDTTGAGDIFCAGIIFGELKNWSIEQKMAFAASAAALKCRGIGNRDTLPTLQEAESLASLMNSSR